MPRLVTIEIETRQEITMIPPKVLIICTTQLVLHFGLRMRQLLKPLAHHIRDLLTILRHQLLRKKCMHRPPNTPHIHQKPKLHLPQLLKDITHPHHCPHVNLHHLPPTIINQDLQIATHLNHHTHQIIDHLPHHHHTSLHPRPPVIDHPRHIPNINHHLPHLDMNQNQTYLEIMKSNRVMKPINQKRINPSIQSLKELQQGRIQ